MEIIKNHLNSFNEYLLSSYSVSGTVSNTMDVAVSKMDKKIPNFLEYPASVGDT